MALPRGTGVLQNYEFHDKLSDASYDYYVYIDRKGQMLIVRANTSGTEIRYAVGRVANYATIIANIAVQNYRKINELEG